MSIRRYAFLLLAAWIASHSVAQEPVSNTPPAADPNLPVVRVGGEGEILWDGEVVDTNTFAARLQQSHDEGDTVAFCGKLTGADVRPTERNVFETLAKKGLKLVLVEDEGAARLPFQASGDEKRPVTVNTVRIREALGLYDQLKGAPSDARALPGADVVLRFDPTSDRGGYVLRRVEVGVVGSSLWLVHESIDEVDSSTSIQYKKQW